MGPYLCHFYLCHSYHAPWMVIYQEKTLKWKQELTDYSWNVCDFSKQSLQNALVLCLKKCNIHNDNKMMVPG